MVKRTSFNHYFYIIFALILLTACWEANRENAVVMAAPGQGSGLEGTGGAIPQQSIRLRILANSDSPSDQWIKREVRDAIVEQMSEWVQEPQGIEEARTTVRNRLPELNELVGKTLSDNGFSYSYEVELGVVPFPAKMYGNEVYPAGDYEALRVSIGSAEGQNWWCVLFPPLCFVDSEAVMKRTDNAEAVTAANNEEEGLEAGTQNKKTQAAGSNKETAESTTVKNSLEQAGGKAEQVKSAMAKPAPVSAEQPEVRFFLWDLIKKIGSMFA